MTTARRQPPLVVEGVEFLSTAFPERAFPPAPGTDERFLRDCRRGYAAMARSQVAITGLARNLGRVLPLTIGRIEALACCFADYRVIVYENDVAFVGDAWALVKLDTDGAVVSTTIAFAPAMLFAPVGTVVDVIALPAVSATVPIVKLDTVRSAEFCAAATV